MSKNDTGDNVGAVREEGRSRGCANTIQQWVWTRGVDRGSGQGEGPAADNGNHKKHLIGKGKMNTAE